MPTILVADDDPVMQSLLNGLLTAQGHTVHIAGNGADAISATASLQPDLIVMDMSMPGVTGFQAVRQIREQTGAALPIIGLSAHTLPDDYTEAYTAGCTAFISKPFQPRALLERISDLLKSP